MTDGSRVTEVGVTVALDVVVSAGEAPTLGIDPFAPRVTVQGDLPLQLQSEYIRIAIFLTFSSHLRQTESCSHSLLS